MEDKCIALSSNAPVVAFFNSTRVGTELSEPKAAADIEPVITETSKFVFVYSCLAGQLVRSYNSAMNFV